ncbi:MAG: response regulator [Deltaproteobacteria bacterium]|nr:response regulator [Deltaproteobacteria bacterium]
MKKIMIVDDEAAVTTQMEARLANMGYDVTQSASSGSEAIEFARRFHPDAVLMDIVMPGGIDGVNATRKINKEMDPSYS